MIRQASPEAREALRQYLTEVERIYADSPVDVQEVLRDIEDHVEEALEGQLAVDEAQMIDVLESLGPPAGWAPADRGPHATGRIVGWGEDRIPVIAVTAALVTAASLLAFPWLGPFPLLGAWVVSRAGLQVARRADSEMGPWIWLLYPAPVMVALGVIALILFGPAMPIAEVAGRYGTAPAMGWTAAGLGAWWVVAGFIVAALAGPVGWVLDPLPLRRRHGHIMALVGGVTAVTGVIFALLAGGS